MLHLTKWGGVLLTLLILVPNILLGDTSYKQSTINIYGVTAKTNPNQDTTKGAGLALEDELLKLKLEVISDFYRAGGMYKFNPMNNTYIKTGLNLNRQKMYAPDNTSDWVNQYSVSAGFGYMLYQDLYLELGVSYTSLNGSDIGTNYTMSDEITRQAYFEIAKRWKTSIGTIDTTANYGIVDYEFVSNKSSYGAVADYYPLPYLKFSYGYQHERDNIANTYGFQYGMYFVKIMDNISYNTNQANFGLKIAFDDLFDFSTWTAPTNLIPHLSELHRFENMVFGANMAIQSTKGVVEKPKPVIPEPEPEANPAPAPQDNGGGDSGSSNSTPTANAGADKSVTVNTAVSITGSGTDSDGTIASYEWKEGATTLATTASFDYTPTSTGDHTLTLTVTDDDGDTHSDTMTVTATAANTAPTASAQSLDAGGGETVTHNLNANIADTEDADNSLTIVVASGPSHGGLSWTGNSFTYEVTDGSFYAGNDSFTYYVRDTQGATSATYTVSITGIFDF